MVKRKDGCDGTIEIEYYTVDGTAHAPDHYVAVDKGSVVFEHGQTSAVIRVPVVDTDQFEEADEALTFRWARAARPPCGFRR